MQNTKYFIPNININAFELSFCILTVISTGNIENQTLAKIY